VWGVKDMTDAILQNILIAIICGVLAWLAKGFWKFLMSDSKNNYDKVNFKFSRNQFFICLFLLIGSLLLPVLSPTHLSEL
jgi:hypothetical protein